MSEGRVDASYIYRRACDEEAPAVAQVRVRVRWLLFFFRAYAWFYRCICSSFWKTVPSLGLRANFTKNKVTVRFLNSSLMDNNLKIRIKISNKSWLDYQKLCDVIFTEARVSGTINWRWHFVLRRCMEISKLRIMAII